MTLRQPCYTCTARTLCECLMKGGVVGATCGVAQALCLLILLLPDQQCLATQGCWAEAQLHCFARQLMKEVWGGVMIFQHLACLSNSLTCGKVRGC